MKIEKFYNKKEGKEQFRARFQMNNREFRPVADSRRRLVEIVDEIRVNQQRGKHGLETFTISPDLKELFERHGAKIPNPKHRNFFERAAGKFLSFSDIGLMIVEVKKAHFQIYIDSRLAEKNQQSGKQIQPETVYKEIYAIRAALKRAELYYPELENWKPPALPKVPNVRGRYKLRRQGLDNPEITLKRILDALREPLEGNRTAAARARLADNLEFRYETGLRRKEVARLQWSNYRPTEEALRNVRRWKTNSITKFFPLSKRAIEIIESRREAQKDSRFIFSTNGNPNESDYRTLKKICAKLEIPYGLYSDSGFVPHDLRHNFASEIVRHTDIETARELLGHSEASMTMHYTHTNEKRMREAMIKRQGGNRRELVAFYKEIRRGKIKVKAFVQKIENWAVY